MTIKRLKMDKVLITGASGLLGTECCKQLKLTSDIWAIDNHSRSSSIPDCNKWLNLDLYNQASFDQLPTDFDYIYHYGAINGTTNFYEFPNKVLSRNFVCDLNVFEFAKRCPNLSKLIYASSSEVVADDAISPVPENTDVVIKNIHNARWSYRLAKITSENFLTNSDLPWVIIRYFNVYGENSKPGHFVMDQIDKINNGIFSITGANETRSFCHVRDAMNASIYCAIKTNKEIINIGNDREITISLAAMLIASALGHPNATFEYLPSLSGSVTNRCPDITKLRSIMQDYNPMSFEAGINQIIGTYLAE